MKANFIEFIRTASELQETQRLSAHATFSRDGIRRKPESRSDTEYRPSFALDADRILHSLAYTRYIDKTQVFSLIRNDHITHRVLHVQLVSKVARTIGRVLGLNEDLIEAVALGHDIGHTPFGHDGETFLSEICYAHGVGCFVHSVQSLQFLDHVERKGKGWNLCLQTLDGILCHDGEIHDQKLEPIRTKTFETVMQETAAKKVDPKTCLIPMTLEACVVRFADTISYIGRDIEDAIRLNIIQRSDLPKDSVSRLGDTNGAIVWHLVTDLIRNSFQQPFICFSSEVSETLRRLKQFNYERIYLNPKVKRHSRRIRELFRLLFERYLSDVCQGNRNSVIFTGFLKDMSESYLHHHQPAEIVRDFIAGMTDRYFLAQCPKNLRPRAIEYKLP